VEGRVNDELKIVTVPRDLYYHEVAYVRGLEAALRRIADPGDGYTTGDGHARCQEIARAALVEGQVKP
jgi:hypothetical protein